MLPYPDKIVTKHAVLNLTDTSFSKKKHLPSLLLQTLQNPTLRFARRLPDTLRNTGSPERIASKWHAIVLKREC